jgi:membrane-bound metal-dependent hydrolase YbcI (DUF457 family)
MLGSSHAASGAAAWSAVCAALPLAGVQVAPATLAVGLFATAGAALLPDLDHEGSTVAYFAPPVSRWICKGVRKVCGGHRRASHTLLAVPVFTAIAVTPAVIAAATGTAWAALPLLFVLLALAIRALHLAPHHHPHAGSALAAAGTLAVWFGHVNLWWLPAAVGLGVLVHILGDALTTEGVPMFWPRADMHNSASWTRHPVLGHTESWRETHVAYRLCVAATAVCVAVPLLAG